MIRAHDVQISFLVWKLKVCGHAATPPVGRSSAHGRSLGAYGDCRQGWKRRQACAQPNHISIYKEAVIRRPVQLPAASLLPTWRTVAPIRHSGPDLDLIHDPGPSTKPSRAASPP